MQPTTTDTTPKILAYAVKVQTAGSISQMVTLHRLLKQVDIGWPYLVDTETNKKGELAVSLDPAYRVEDYNKLSLTETLVSDADTYLVYRPDNSDAPITKHYVEALIKWLGTSQPAGIKFEGKVEIIPITTTTHQDWYYDYEEEKFIVDPSNTMEEDVEDGMEHGFLPANLSPTWMLEIEKILVTEAEEATEVDEPTPPTSTTPVIGATA